MKASCPSERCPCVPCAGARARAERRTQGLPERIEDPVVYRRWGQFLEVNRRRGTELVERAS
jgi:hypothetical protein